MSKESLYADVHSPNITVVTVKRWPETDQWYSHVVLRLPDGYVAAMSATDAQRLGHALNNAGGGVLAKEPA